MPNSNRIAILLHECDEQFARSRYLVRFLTERWESRGLKIFLARGIDHLIEADAVLLHVPLTTIPADYLSFAHRHPLVLNRGSIDISKPVTIDSLADESYGGAVIVKTKLNCGGTGETFLESGPMRRALRRVPFPASLLRLRKRVVERFALALGSPTTLTQYPIYPSIADVPEFAREGSFVIEKFRPEADGSFFALRKAFFFGSREVNLLIRSRDPLIRHYRLDDCESIEPDPDVSRFRRMISLDFGEIDYVASDDGLVFLDVNRPPMAPDGRIEALVDELEAGILDFIE